MADIMEEGTIVYRVAKEGTFPILVRKVTRLRLEDGSLILTLNKFDPDPNKTDALAPSRDEETIAWPVDNLFLSYSQALEYQTKLIEKTAEKVKTEPKEMLLERIFSLLECMPNSKKELYWLKPWEEDRLFYRDANEKAKSGYIRELVKIYAERDVDHEENH